MNAKVIMQTKDVLSGDKLEAAFKSLHTRGQKLQRDVHVAAVSVLVHLEKHKDTRMVSKLMNALPQSYRTNAVREWFEYHSPVTFGAKDEVLFDKNKKFNVTAAMVTPFWEFSQEKPYVALDMDAWIASAIKKLELDAKNTNRDHSIIITSLKVQRTNPAIVDPSKVAPANTDPLAAVN
jgi:hypothetical protein